VYIYFTVNKRNGSQTFTVNMLLRKNRTLYLNVSNRMTASRSTIPDGKFRNNLIYLIDGASLV